jgi:hypothetical protein
MPDSERRRRVDAIVDGALERDAGDRRSFVSAACAGDEALREEIEALLAHASGVDHFLAAPLAAAAAGVLAADVSLVGRIMVARYSIDRGSFRAEQPRLWSEQAHMRHGPTRSFDLHPDGNRVVMSPLIEPPGAAAPARIVFVFNFFDELRQAGAANALRRPSAAR